MTGSRRLADALYDQLGSRSQSWKLSGGVAIVALALLTATGFMVVANSLTGVRGITQSEAGGVAFVGYGVMYFGLLAGLEVAFGDTSPVAAAVATVLAGLPFAHVLAYTRLADGVLGAGAFQTTVWAVPHQTFAGVVAVGLLVLAWWPIAAKVGLGWYLGRPTPVRDYLDAGRGGAGDE